MYIKKMEDHIDHDEAASCIFNSEIGCEHVVVEADALNSASTSGIPRPKLIGDDDPLSKPIDNCPLDLYKAHYDLQTSSSIPGSRRRGATANRIRAKDTNGKTLESGRSSSKKRKASSLTYSPWESTFEEALDLDVEQEVSPSIVFGFPELNKVDKLEEVDNLLKDDEGLLTREKATFTLRDTGDGCCADSHTCKYPENTAREETMTNCDRFKARIVSSDSESFAKESSFVSNARPQEGFQNGSPVMTNSLERKQCIKYNDLGKTEQPSPQASFQEFNDDLLSVAIHGHKEKMGNISTSSDLGKEHPSKNVAIKAKEQVLDDVVSLDKVKLKLYMEAMKVHNGKGCDRLFADYWDALGRYLSTGENVRSNDDAATNGVEAVLAKFLLTKKLRRLHNTFLKMIMKQCLGPIAPRQRVNDHIPLNWRGKVKTILKKRKPEDQVTSSDIDLDNFGLLQKEFSTHSITFGNCGKKGMELYSPASGGKELNDLIHSHSQSPRLPGTLEIDHVSRHITEKDGYCLSQSAQWLTVIAVRDYLKQVLQKTLTRYEPKESKKRRISSYDFAQVMDRKDFRSDVKPPFQMSRIAWEHFTSTPCILVPPVSNSELHLFQESLEKMAHTDMFKREDQRKKLVAQSSGGSRSRLGQGKDLSAMMARQSKNKTPLRSSTPLSEVRVKGMPLPQAQNKPHLQGSLFQPELEEMVKVDAFVSDDIIDLPSRTASMTSLQADLSNMHSRDQNTNEFSGGGTSSVALEQIGLALSRPNSTATCLSQGTDGISRASSSSNPIVTRNSSGSNPGSITDPTHMSTSSLAAKKPLLSASGTNGRGRGRGSKDLSAMLARNKAK